MAVVEIFGRRFALFAFAYYLCVRSEIESHSCVEGIERALPKSGIAAIFAVSHDSTLHLVDLVKATVLHYRSKNFAADATGAISNDCFVLQVVVLSTLDLSNKILTSCNVRDDGVLEFTDLGFKCIASIEEDHFIQRVCLLV